MTLADEVGPPPGSGDRAEEASLEDVARVARDRVPGMDHVSVFLVEARGPVRTLAATSELARELDSVQIRLAEGPLFGSDARLLEVPHLEQDRRWPGYARAAVAAGLRAQLVARVPVDDQGGVAGLNLYSTHGPDIHPDAGTVAVLFASHAAAALGAGPDRAGIGVTGSGSSTVTEALRAREVVGQATGIIADRYEMTQDRAFAFLVRAASQSNMLLRDVAQELVDRRNSAPSTGRA